MITLCFFFNDTATTEIYTRSLHDSLPICAVATRTVSWLIAAITSRRCASDSAGGGPASARSMARSRRSEEHTSELQSRQYIVCRLLLENKVHRFSRYLEYAYHIVHQHYAP